MSACQSLASLGEKMPEIVFVEFLRWDKGRKISAHSHEDVFQLDYFPEGNGIYEVDGKSHSPDAQTFFFVPHGIRHRISGSDDKPLLNLTVKFKHDNIAKDFLPSSFKLAVHMIGRAASLFRQLISEAILGTEEGRILAVLRLSELLILLHSNRLGKDRSSKSFSPAVETARQIMLRDIKKELSLSVLANQIGITKEHFCRIFKKETGLSPIDFLRYLRVEHAKRELAGNSRPITQIVVNTGFSNIQEMDRAFKKFAGMSAVEYGRENRWKIKPLSLK